MKRHPVDPLSFVLGMAFLIIGGLWTVWEQGIVERTELIISVPIILIVGGLAGIVLSALTAHRRKESSHE